MTNEADFNETFKYHGVDLVADKFHILNGIGLNRILNGWVNGYVETVELDHFLKAPDSDFAVFRGWNEISWLWLNWC